MKSIGRLLLCGAAALTTVALAGRPSDDWPSFRGPDASGVAADQNIPQQWSGESGLNIAWKTPIPGLAHSSPIVYGDRIFVTTAVSSAGEATFKPGLYGEGTASEDRSVQEWRLLCVDARTGSILWQKTAYRGLPRSKRHIKSTYANATPATNGSRIAAFFGSEGLFVFDMDGNMLWKRDLGDLDVGAYDLPEYEWGPASSPIIYSGLVIMQCDTQGESFIEAFDIETGRTVWRTLREELPSWGTPTVYHAGGRAELVTNGSNWVRAYNPKTGEELWRLGGSSKITAPTPVFTDDLIVVASGRRPQKPIFAIRPGGRGDITPPAGAGSGVHVAWSTTGRGPYMPTPLIYDGYLYILANQGFLDCYELETGREIHRQRIPHGGAGFSASPVAADGRIYLSGEDGDIFVVRAGTDYELLSKNPMGESLMATPAIADDTLYVRGAKSLFAVRSAAP